MAEAQQGHRTLGAGAARQLANTTKTPPIWSGTTPRWLVSLLPWTPVEAGTYRVNKVRDADENSIAISCSPGDDDKLPASFVDYEDAPREYTLSTVTTTLDVQTRISDLYRSPMDQVREQLGVLLEMVKERQENELVNNASYGLLTSASPGMRVSTRSGAPTPDDLDELIIKVWKEPAFFLAHPRAIAAFGRECNRRGVCPDPVEIDGKVVRAWRGVPLLPSEKMPVSPAGTTAILALRLGDTHQGVVGLRPKTLPDEIEPAVNVRFMGIDDRAVLRYLVSLYYSVAVLVPDAVGVLDDVEVGR